jgi:hypothetical protein
VELVELVFFLAASAVVGYGKSAGNYMQITASSNAVQVKHVPVLSKRIFLLIG